MDKNKKNLNLGKVNLSNFCDLMIKIILVMILVKLIDYLLKLLLNLDLNLILKLIFMQKVQIDLLMMNMYEHI